ncbi:unnamed protein product [Microthlaspi erraticum]|uniref:RNase H type-1 domain-containing protein n=1 Tax=Microthlaspi erraticum TaxID=1685480 RepID=A0A6D2HYV0_9BRAS|nr:unnamed protein product [Microthlaspi erraticum]
MFFNKTSPKSCESLRAILQKYEEASGQQINLSKSSVTFSRKTPQEIRTRVKATLGIEKEGGQGKYLGLPESFGRRKKDLFTVIVDRIRQRAIKYSSRFLSAAGKMTMIKSVLSAIPTYAMSCFKLPAGLCKRIQSAITRFWWDTTIGKKKMCWLSWTKLTRSKKQGGLGFREIQSFNDSLLEKISWRILQNPSCLLSKVLLGKYCKHKVFLDVPITSSTSHGWRGILIGRDLLKTRLGRAIGDGLSTSLWNDQLLSFKMPSRPMGPPRAMDQNLKVSDIINEQTREWNHEKIGELLPTHMEEIRALRPSKRGASDSYLWLPTKSGEYTAKTGYYAAMEREAEPHLHQTPNHLNWDTDIWQTKVSPKLKVFQWKIVQEALPIGENLLNRGILDNACCVYCGELETTEHLFLHCEFVQKVWNLAPFSINIEPPTLRSFTNTLVSSKDWICLLPIGIGAGPLFPWICWTLWKARNYLIFEERPFSPTETMNNAIVEAKEWQQAQSEPQKKTLRHAQLNQNATPPNSILCFTDGAWSEINGIGGLGWVFVDGEGTNIDSGQGAEQFISSPLMAEALAIRSALQHALEKGFSQIHIKSDAQEVIRAITKQELVKELYGVLFDIKTLASLFDSISFSSIPRSENTIADTMAKIAKNRLVSLLSFWDPFDVIAN